MHVSGSSIRRVNKNLIEDGEDVKHWHLLATSIMVRVSSSEGARPGILGRRLRCCSRDFVTRRLYTGFILYRDVE